MATSELSSLLANLRTGTISKTELFSRLSKLQRPDGSGGVAAPTPTAAVRSAAATPAPSIPAAAPPAAAVSSASSPAHQPPPPPSASAVAAASHERPVSMEQYLAATTRTAGGAASAGDAASEASRRVAHAQQLRLRQEQQRAESEQRRAQRQMEEASIASAERLAAEIEQNMQESLSLASEGGESVRGQQQQDRQARRQTSRRERHARHEPAAFEAQRAAPRQQRSQRAAPTPPRRRAPARSREQTPTRGRRQRRGSNSSRGRASRATPQQWAEGGIGGGAEYADGTRESKQWESDSTAGGGGSRGGGGGSVRSGAASSRTSGGGRWSRTPARYRHMRTGHEECSFTPAVEAMPTEVYPDTVQPASGGGERQLSTDAFRQRSLAWQKRRERSLIAAQQEAARRDEAECTFVPNTRASMHSAGLVDDGHGAWHRTIQSGEIHNRLYDDKRLERAKKRSAQKILQQRQEQFDKDCTFTPKVSGTPDGHITRSRYMQETPSSRNRRTGGEQNDLPKDATFTPKTNAVPPAMISAKAYLSVDTFERLYCPPAASTAESTAAPLEEEPKKKMTRKEVQQRQRAQKQFFAQLESHNLRKEKNLQQARRQQKTKVEPHSPKINAHSIRLVERAQKRIEASETKDVPVRYESAEDIAAKKAAGKKGPSAFLERLARDAERRKANRVDLHREVLHERCQSAGGTWQGGLWPGHTEGDHMPTEP